VIGVLSGSEALQFSESRSSRITSPPAGMRWWICTLGHRDMGVKRERARDALPSKLINWRPTAACAEGLVVPMDCAIIGVGRAFGHSGRARARPVL
jgi:hypothetical protein